MNIGDAERMQLLREISDMRQDFERLYLADAKGKIETTREATLSRSAIPKPSMTIAQLHKQNRWNQLDIGGGGGIELGDRQPQTIEEMQTSPTFYARRTGVPIVNANGYSLVLRAGWDSWHNYELSGTHSQESKAAIERANKWVNKRCKFVSLALFPDRNRDVTFSGFCWPDVVLQVAEQTDATTTLTQWKVTIGEVELVENEDGIETLEATCNRRLQSMSVEFWEKRHNGELTWGGTAEPFVSITKADELYIGDEPEIYYCERDIKVFLRDSELALDWLRRKVERDTKQIVATKKTGSRNTSKNAGRKPIYKAIQTPEEKRVWGLHFNQGKSAAIIASDLFEDIEKQDYVQQIINRVRTRKKRIEKREKPNVSTDS